MQPMKFTAGLRSLLILAIIVAANISRAATISISASYQAAEPAAQGYFYVTTDQTLASSLTIYYTVSGTAQNGVDYSTLPGSFTLPAGLGPGSYASIMLQPINDSLVEGAETVVLTLTPNANYTVSSTAGTASNLIFDDEKPTIRIFGTSPAYESGLGGYFSVQKYPAAGGAVTVNYTISGTAQNGVDYSTISGSVVVPSGTASANIPINAINDSLAEGTETVTLTLSSSSAYVLDQNTAASLSIYDNDDTAVTITATDSVATEPGTDTASFTVTRSGGGTASPLTVLYTISGSAVKDTDYTIPIFVTIPANQSSTVVTVTPIDDGLLEGDESVQLTLTTDAGSKYYVGSPSVASIIIKDNDQTATPPSWVTGPLHTWSPRLGGGMWYQEQAVVDNIAPVLAEYPRPVLVGIRSDRAENGYRFDKDEWSPNAEVYSYWTDRCSQECVIQTLLTSGNVEFMWSIPTPDVYSPTPYNVLPAGAKYGDSLGAAPYNQPKYYVVSLPLGKHYKYTDPSAGDGKPYKLWLDGVQIPKDGDFTPGLTSQVVLEGVASELITAQIIPLGTGYPWQRAAYYAAYVQYMTAPTTMTAAQYGALQTTYDFFTDASCTTTNAASDAAVGGNWANLRARRGHPAPYPIQAILLGIEPYGTAQEDMGESGARYGAIAESFQKAIRGRGGVSARIPLGLNVYLGGAISDFGRTWFKPMMDAVTRSEFSYFDLYHHYRFGQPTDLVNRIFPNMTNTGPVAGIVKSPGWQNWWLERSDWGTTDFSRYLWMYDDIKQALTKYGETPSRWKYGVAEHGLSLDSQFIGNDMGAGIHWALYLSEIMSYNADYDMNWVLAEQGFSHAQIHYRDYHITRTPGHYVYKMAQEFYGFEYLGNTFTSPSAQTGSIIVKGENQGNYSSDDVVVKTFRNPADNHYHLFVINKHTANTATLTGWENWKIVSWGKLSASSFTDQNPIGNYDPMDLWHRETVKTVQNSFTDGQALSIPTISVNHIELAPPQPGAIDSTFTGVVNNGMVSAIATQSDGKILVGGTFTMVNGVSKSYIARLNASGSTDASFASVLNGSVTALAVESSGKIIVGGSFTLVGGTTRNYLARLNSDGSLDTAYNPNFYSTVSVLALQSDGKLIVLGSTDISRYNTDGTRDSPGFSSPYFDGTPNGVAIQSDGKLIVVGSFTHVNADSRAGVVRLTTSGSIDSTFASGSLLGGTGNSVVLQSDGKILVGGSFTTAAGVTRKNLARFNSTGSLDTGFADPNLNNTVNAIALQTDGKVLVGGSFTMAGASSAIRNRLAKFASDGSLYVAFDPGTLLNNQVMALKLQTDKRIFAGGLFSPAAGQTIPNRITKIVSE